MDLTDVARLQFAATTVYHFLFVPLTIGLTGVVAAFETSWLRTKNPEYLRLTKFFGKLMLINFAIGVVTGIVQEFQFGMNWSSYSRFVGDIFGAPLAIEGLLAFFLESTFLGLWIFGWDRLPRGLHATTMWLTHIGTLFSAYFILAANSWMQHPVGYAYNPDTGRAELHDFGAVMFNKVQLVTFPHVILAAYMTAGAFVVGVSGWLYLREARRPEQTDAVAVERSLYRRGIRIGAVVTLIASLGVAISGDVQGKIMTEVQPMKMAAAEALYDTEQPASFSILTIGTPDGQSEKFAIKIPKLLSFLATGEFDGRVQGINELRAQYEQQYGQDPGAAYYAADGYVPNIPLTYWSFRYMIGVGMLGALLAAGLLWLTRKNKAPTGRWWPALAVATPVLVTLGSSFGWIFTEAGRQPWAVFGLMSVDQAVSASVTGYEVWTSLIVFTVLYAVLAVIELRLLATFVRMGAPAFSEPPTPSLRRTDDDTDDAPMAFAY
ncbi:cytochrome ubiquinol oxidase subunit I [Nocardioides acrostichi]|uniref:Cytochrome ubiquinol oxidase subunit I n=1 Tax=Nocardioides acrostichi TaxID=2784339 RepID=A0A930UVN6_9ACTN|nr:cytochrome ubiquinol oxidase subunit I [Nocardioides acrostichi]MBF4161713.1 cytochrome ubiquinol oxidase subunit I [Nocardioides acrostichi]